MLRYLTVKNIPVSDLYTIDLICHGVPGAKLFADYTSWLTEKLGRDNEEMAAFSFRRKSLGNIEFMETVLFSSGSANREETIPFTKSCYYRMFLAGESYRDACYHCNYATVDKPADITLGDYFEARDDYPELFTKNAPLGNASYLNCIIVHSKKGQELLSTSRHRLFIQEVGVQEVQMSHFQLKLPSSFSRVRFAAIEAYEAGGINKIVNMYRIDDAKILPLRGTHKILGLLHRIHH